MSGFEALGAAAAIAQFSGMGLKLIRLTNDIYGSTTGFPTEYHELITVVTDAERLSQSILKDVEVQPDETEDEASIRELAAESKLVAEELLLVLEPLRGRVTASANLPRARRLAALGPAFKLAWKEHDIKLLESRLQRIMGEMSARTTNLLRYNYVHFSIGLI
jgi:hypothetical protein